MRVMIAEIMALLVRHGPECVAAIHPRARPTHVSHPGPAAGSRPGEGGDYPIVGADIKPRFRSGGLCQRSPVAVIAGGVRCRDGEPPGDAEIHDRLSVRVFEIEVSYLVVHGRHR